jgi:serine/threonine protein kinase
MNYPLISEYIDAVKAAEDNFEELKNLRPVLDDDGQPVMSSGNFAVVFKMTDGKKNYAVKCFTKAQDGRDSAYRLISEELQKIQSPYILKVRYLDKELFVDTTQTEETEFPVLLMDWVEGQTLSSFLQNIANNYDEDYSFWSEEEEKTALFELKCLPYNFIRAASWLIKQPFAHGDIKPDNIIIKPDGTCVLVDYDGMYVPAMQGMKMQCMGTPNFRYPLINDQRFDKSLDNYSIAIIALSLRAFALEPERISECDDFCIITEKETSKLHEHRLFKDEVMMSDNLFRDLLAIYLHTLSQNKLDSDFFDSCISEYLCPDNYDISSTKVSDSEKENYWEDLYGVRYSLDGRKVISTSKGLKGVDYTIREGVLTVCDQAFQSRELHSITLPESVVAIGDRAFANNDDMEYCNIPSSVRFIYDNNPWGGCFNIKKLDCKSSCYIIRDGLLYSSDFDIVYGLIYWNPNINIDLRTKKISANAIWSARKKYDSFIKKIDLSNVIEIGNAAFKLCKNAKFSSLNMIEGIGKESFMYCESLEEIDLSKVKRIPEEAFSYCNNLKKIKFSQELQYIDKYAFKGCYNLTNIDLAKTVCYISIDSLDDCRFLTDINVNSDNEYYCSIEGVLFNKNITKLIKYPSGKQASEYEIPQSVYEIGDEAFVDCKSLKVIRCKNKIKTFGKRVFEKCSNLNTCHIDIDDNAGVEVKWILGRQLFLLENATEETKKEGFNLIQESASLDYPTAQMYLANIYKNGRKVEVDTEKYLSWLERCASNGHYRAMSQLGREYLTGKNTTRNLQKAYELLSKLEEIGEDAERDCHGNFYVLLGAFYETGEIVTKDVKKAVQYYSKGVEWHDSVAEFNLARCYENGIGLDIDLYKAKEYYSLADKHKYVRANEALERVKNLLNGESNRADDLPF